MRLVIQIKKRKITSFWFSSYAELFRLRGELPTTRSQWLAFDS
jgi:hypothetical protein